MYIDRYTQQRENLLNKVLLERVRIFNERVAGLSHMGGILKTAYAHED